MTQSRVSAAQTGILAPAETDAEFAELLLERDQTDSRFIISVIRRTFNSFWLQVYTRIRAEFTTNPVPVRHEHIHTYRVVGGGRVVPTAFVGVSVYRAGLKWAKFIGLLIGVLLGLVANYFWDASSVTVNTGDGMQVPVGEAVDMPPIQIAIVIIVALICRGFVGSLWPSRTMQIPTAFRVEPTDVTLNDTTAEAEEIVTAGGTR